MLPLPSPPPLAVRTPSPVSSISPGRFESFREFHAPPSSTSLSGLIPRYFRPKVLLSESHSVPWMHDDLVQVGQSPARSLGNPYRTGSHPPQDSAQPNPPS